MKKNSSIFLRVVVLLIGIGALIFMLWEPHFEGRNVGATFYEIYFKDAFLAYAYVASIPFFVALYQLFKLFGYIAENKLFSADSIKALRIINYSAVSIVCFALLAEVYLFIFQSGKDDITGGIFMGLIIIAISGVVSIVSGKFAKNMQTRKIAQ